MNNLKHFINYYMGFGKWIDKFCWAGFGKVGMLLAGMLLLAIDDLNPKNRSAARSARTVPEATLNFKPDFTQDGRNSIFR